ncbi:MAG: sugar ABC transporter permease [Erysipelotrichaceae bacterium]|nr:sugar ABC transporter permease [Erysipelotrichaceae bacterium]
MANALSKKRSSFFEPVINFFQGFHKRFVDGSIGTKLSHFILGAGNLYHKQFVKGFIYLALQIVFVLYMVLCPEVNGTPFGYKSLGNLITLGTEEGGTTIVGGRPVQIPTDNSVLMLLFGIVTLGIIAVYLIAWISNIKSSALADLAIEQGKKPSTIVEDIKSLLDDRFHVLMLTPTLIACLVFTIIPTIFMISMAFTSYNELDMKIEGTRLFNWNGFDNFVYMFSGGNTLGEEIKNRFIPVLIWTMIWAVFATFTCYFGGIILAILINKKGVKGKKIFRTVFIMTIALPTFISLLAVRNLLNANGPVNAWLMNMGITDKPISFLQLEPFDNSPMIARIMVIIINMWVGIPYTMLMTSGILMNIPEDLYEAATVDGASKMKMFFKITLPYIIFVTTPYLIGSFVGNINSFNIIFLLTGGGPAIPNSKFSAGQTDLLVTWLYKLTITDKQYNTGAVVGILTFIITSTLTLFTYRRSKAYNEEDTFQ